MAIDNGDLKSQKIIQLSSKSTAVYNALETFATFFVSGVTDEVLAYESIGHSYVDTIKCYLPDILLLNDDGKYFNNALELLFLWI